ncbi:MAG TPA: ribonuclease P protein component [bacterium]|nr:ribonuclease P protein component [bacterium]HQL62250.1 ribonuclease P protein component [bacterium]
MTEPVKSPQTRQTFRRHERLRGRRDFERLRAGRRIDGAVLAIRCMPSPASVSRLGVQVGRKVGSAVVRNRVKRRLREQFRQLKHRIKEPTDILVWAFPESAAASSALIRKELESALLRADLLIPPVNPVDQPIP